MEKSSINNAPVQVSRHLLETLISLAGELVLGRNQLVQGINNGDMSVIETSGQSIDLITSEIQDAIMQTRMQSVAGLFETIGQKFGDQVKLDKTGKKISLDRTILDAIREPLDALVQIFINAGADAFQTEKETEKKDNSPIVLKALQETGQVNIVVSKAGVLLSATDVPGHIHGVIEEFGGIIEVDALEEKGSTVSMKLPLTLAIIPSQMISIGEEQFAVPQANLSELLRIPAAEVKNRIEKIGDADVIRLRGELMPLLNLSDLLGIKKYCLNPETSRQTPDRRTNVADRRSRKYHPDGHTLNTDITGNEENIRQREDTDRRQHRFGVTNIAIVSAGNYKYGLVVDKFHDSEEIVVKPVGRHLKGCKAYAGATIMGDGKVCLILDILNLAQMAELSTMSESKRISNNLSAETILEKDKEAIVLFKNMETEYFAASFEHVHRIERVATTDIEKIENQTIIQYRGKALRLYELSEIADVAALPKRERQEVIVFSVEDKEFGLMVSPPVDILERHLDIDENNFRQPGMKGTMNIDGHTTLVLDIPETAEALWMEVCNHV